MHNAFSYLSIGSLFVTHLNKVRPEKEEVSDGQSGQNQAQQGQINKAIFDRAFKKTGESRGML